MARAEQSETDRVEALTDEPFAYAGGKDGSVWISFRGREVTTLRGTAAARFRERIAAADGTAAQLLMAKATGNFKRGNERGSTRP